MQNSYEKLQACLNAVRNKTDFTPQVALVLGSGLGGYAHEIDIALTLNYSEIPGFPTSTVPGHSGRFVFGLIHGVPVVIMQGRIHYYEGYDISDVVLPIRLMRLMGADVLMLTNAVGAINETFSAGDFMLIEDQILYSVPSPLRGENVEALGTRFPDMSEVYNRGLRNEIIGAADALSIPLQKGVYIQVSGPSFETPAEIRAYRALGADVVGMSTACEAIAANHMGMKICGISCVANMAAGISKTPLTHEEVQAAADAVAPQFKKLITESIARIGKACL